MASSTNLYTIKTHMTKLNARACVGVPRSSCSGNVSGADPEWARGRGSGFSTYP
ncbi:MAG TPA: hypothetical protein V6D12_06765 [Candidatus Obscuribacterales bacterium]